MRHEFVHAAVRGAGWAAGRQLAHAVPLLALVALLAVCALVGLVGGRR